MSDFNSSLPVRTENAGDVIAKIADATIPSQQLAIDASGKITAKLDDAAGNGITSQANGGQQALDVGIDVGGVQIDPRQVRALTSADIVTADQGSANTSANGWPVKLTDGTNTGAVSAAGELSVQVTQALPAGSNVIGSVNQGTSPWISKDQADGPVSPGAAASFSQLGGAVYSSSLPTLTDGQQVALQTDSNGRLLVDTSGTDNHDYGVVGANTLRTAAQIGNATGAADFNAGATGAQTLRTEANQGAPGIAANGWFIRPTDGTNSQSFTAAGEAKVDITVALPAGSNTIGNVGVTNLPSTVDTNYGVVGASTLRTASELGNSTGSLDYNFGTVGAQTLRAAAEIGNATGAADFNNGATGAQTLRVAANLAVGGANVSGTNPVPVSITSALVGTSINNYNTSAALASGGSSNHIYTITAGKTFQGKKIWGSASGKLKIEVRVSPDGSTYSTLWVGFNSTAEPNISIDLDQLVFLESGAGSTIEVIRTNEDKASMDVYSTISGTEV